MSGDRPYARVPGLRSKACPPSQRGSSSACQIEGPCQGQVERCLALLRPNKNITPRENVSSGSGALSETRVDTLSVSSSQANNVLMPVAQ